MILAATASHVTFRLRRDAYEKSQLGPYVLEEKIGEGGMGEVHRARHALLRRPTAIKLVRAHLGQDGLQRFEREVRMTSRLTHPNTIGIYDYGRTADGVFYYAMELLLGADLGEVQEVAAPLPTARVIHILEQACGALAEAHGHGLVHRDVKPGNLFLCERGGLVDVVKVMDFGLVKSHDPDDSKLTQMGAVVGTPRYMSPEAFSGGEIDARSDLYALGAVAYELLAGRPVFDASAVGEVIVQHLQQSPTPPSEHVPSVPPDLERIVLRCLAKDPGDRPGSAAVLREELLRCEDAGRWTQEDARAWWADHLPGRIHPADTPSA